MVKTVKIPTSVPNVSVPAQAPAPAPVPMEERTAPQPPPPAHVHTYAHQPHKEGPAVVATTPVVATTLFSLLAAPFVYLKQFIYATLDYCLSHETVPEILLSCTLCLLIAILAVAYIVYICDKRNRQVPFAKHNLISPNARASIGALGLPRGPLGDAVLYHPLWSWKTWLRPCWIVGNWISCGWCCARHAPLVKSEHLKR